MESGARDPFCAKTFDFVGDLDVGGLALADVDAEGVAGNAEPFDPWGKPRDFGVKREVWASRGICALLNPCERSRSVEPLVSSFFGGGLLSGQQSLILNHGVAKAGFSLETAEMSYAGAFAADPLAADGSNTSADA
jgi:hypothetical protein